MIPWFDITQAAQSYAEVSGVIAGFGITVLVFLIERTLSTTDHSDVEGQGPQMAFAMIAYVILTMGAGAVLWGFISGLDGQRAVQTWSLVLLAGANATLSVVMLVQSLFLIVPPLGPMAFIRQVEGYFEMVVVLINAMGILFFNVMIFGELRGLSDLNAALSQQTGPIVIAALLLIVGPLAGGLIGRSYATTMPSFSVFYTLLLVWLGVLSAVFAVIAFAPNGGLSTVGVLMVDAVWAVLATLGIRFLRLASAPD